MTKEAMKLALEALENFKNDDIDAVESFEQCETAITALREALAEQPAQQEPVATKLETQQFNCFHVSAKDFQKLKDLPVGAKLYTSPPAAQRTWVGLTDEEIDAIGAKIFSADFLDVEEIHANRDIARAIEAAHGIGEKK